MIKYCWWHFVKRLWRYSLLSQLWVFEEFFIVILLTLSELQSHLLNNLRKFNKSQNNQKLCLKIQFLSLFLNITKVANIWWKILVYMTNILYFPFEFINIYNYLPVFSACSFFIISFYYFSFQTENCWNSFYFYVNRSNWSFCGLVI